ncbi:MAG: PH domain-containing protein [Deltaproteobacteria bacterium]|nr:MAG: PH domain-containing protein [Deltaproteobacteria bacterium]
MGREDTYAFRLRPLLKWIVAGAAQLWLFILALLLWQGEAIPVHTYLSALFFVALFTAVFVFYSGLTISVDRYGVTYRGLFSFRTYPFDSILKMEVHDGLSGRSYDVFTKRGMLHFSSFIQDHARLFDLIADRADLKRRGRIVGV